MPQYTFTGTQPEEFPAPPICRLLEPGDVVDTGDVEVEHARLELTKSAAKSAPKSAAKSAPVAATATDTTETTEPDQGQPAQ